jgi:single-strand DNA-binding protein
LNYNKVILGGNLCRDFESRSTPGGLTVANNALAVNRRWKGEDGQDREEVTFVNITAFDKQAETLLKHTKKGDCLLVEGRLKMDKWEKDGVKHSTLSVVISTFQFANGPKSKDEPGDDGDRPFKGAYQTSKPKAAPKSEAQDDDIPF